MNVMLAAQDWGQLVIPILVFIIYGIASLIKNVGDQQAKAKRRPPAPLPARPAPKGMEAPRDMMSATDRPAPVQASPQQEMERLLDELGLKRPPKPAPTPNQPPTRPRPSGQRPPKPPRDRSPRPPKPKPVESERAIGRHLHSNLENRHAESVHSEIETKHLASKVEHRPLDKESTADPALLPVKGRDAGLASLFHNRDLLRRAFVLGMVLGPPAAFDDRGENLL